MPELRLPERWSLRTRIVGVAALVVTAVLVVGGLLLGWALRQTLTEDLQQVIDSQSGLEFSVFAGGTMECDLHNDFLAMDGS